MPPCASSLLIDVLPERCNGQDEQDGDKDWDDPPENHHPATPSEISIAHHSQFTVVLLVAFSKEKNFQNSKITNPVAESSRISPHSTSIRGTRCKNEPSGV